jgi:hypothetical protein
MKFFAKALFIFIYDEINLMCEKLRIILRHFE